MLRHIAIENFKGIGTRVELELKPVTLLFGPNSAGKSTILHAIHYAHALFESGNPDVGRTRLGGELDLGGFKAFSHNHKHLRPVVLGFVLQPETEGVLRVAEEALGREFERIDVEVAIRWSMHLNHPIVTRFAVALEGEPLAELGCTLDGARTWLTNVNRGHRALGHWRIKGYKVVEDQIPCLPGRRMALPRFDEGLNIEHPDEEDEKSGFFDLIENLLLGAGRSLIEQLSKFRYVGPLRRLPKRDFRPPETTDEASWSNGLGAWDELARDHVLRREVSDWLADDSRLATGYFLEWVEYWELDEESLFYMEGLARENELDETFSEIVDYLVRRGRLVIMDEAKQLKLSPCDVGEGFAQLVPVLAAALSRKMVTSRGRKQSVKLVAIEQPELHLHPRMEVVLADLFLSQCNDRQFLIETHSEHLMLRLLRRVRETEDNELPPEAPSASLEQVLVLYVQRQDGEVAISPLEVSKDGDFLDEWPHGFFDERDEELF